MDENEKALVPTVGAGGHSVGTPQFERFSEAGKAHHWVKGSSGNPKGRPKKISDALNKVVNKKRARAMAEAIVTQAEKGNVLAFQEVANRIEGKVAQAITGEDGGPMEIAIITHNIGMRK